MSGENAETVRRAYDAFNRGDLEGMVADLAAEFEYLATGRCQAPLGYTGGRRA